MPKVGRKFSDRRFQSDDGQLWDSRFEWVVWDGLTRSGYRIRRCDEGDSINYNTKVAKGRCLECKGVDIVQERVYTPDLFVVGRKGERSAVGGGYYVELKGYFPAEKRSLLCSVANQATGVDLRVVFQRVSPLKGTKTTNVEYMKKYCKNTLIGVWNPNKEDIDWV